MHVEEYAMYTIYCRKKEDRRVLSFIIPIANTESRIHMYIIRICYEKIHHLLFHVQCACSVDYRLCIYLYLVRKEPHSNSK